MINILRTLFLTIILLLVAVSPGAVSAQAKPEVLDSPVSAEFPARLTFSVSARSGADIVDVRLRYQIERVRFARVTSEVLAEFDRGTQVNASWTMDMVKIGGLPPGTYLDYWWLVKDASGARTETAPRRFQFNDSRYSWRSLTEGQVNLYWYQGEQSFAVTLMAAAQESLVRVAKDIGARPGRPVSLYIYASADDLKKSMIFPQEWTGGVTFTGYGVIAIGIGPAQLSWGKRTIAHELTHLVIDQVTAGPYSNLPTWLNEGLAMYAEGELEASFRLLLERAAADKKLISVHSLSSPFPASAEKSYLSYAESFSVVDYLLRNYGQAKMLELLNTFKVGATYDYALKAVYGFDMDGLDTRWREYMYSRPR